MTSRAPTYDEIREKASMPCDPGDAAIALWYPQMGGYVGKAIAVWRAGTFDECFDAEVWHDGEFPFGDDDRDAAYLHHCGAEQFVMFGLEVAEARLRAATVRPAADSVRRWAELRDRLVRLVAALEAAP